MGVNYCAPLLTELAGGERRENSVSVVVVDKVIVYRPSNLTPSPAHATRTVRHVLVPSGCR